MQHPQHSMKAIDNYKEQIISWPNCNNCAIPKKTSYNEHWYALKGANFYYYSVKKISSLGQSKKYVFACAV